MKTQALIPAFNPRSFRFKYWSRKSYAAFNSLRLVVNIGVLRFDICEKLAAKSIECFALETTLAHDNTDSLAQEEIEHEWQSIIQLFLSALACFIPMCFSVNYASGRPYHKLTPQSIDFYPLPNHRNTSTTHYNTFFSLLLPFLKVSLAFTQPIDIKFTNQFLFKSKPDRHDEKDDHDAYAWHHEHGWL